MTKRHYTDLQWKLVVRCRSKNVFLYTSQIEIWIADFLLNKLVARLLSLPLVLCASVTQLTDNKLKNPYLQTRAQIILLVFCFLFLDLGGRVDVVHKSRRFQRSACSFFWCLNHQKCLQISAVPTVKAGSQATLLSQTFNHAW